VQSLRLNLVIFCKNAMVRAIKEAPMEIAVAVVGIILAAVGLIEHF
jgi:hypothetical protein